MKAIEATGRFNESGELKVDNLPDIRNQKVRLLILLEENEQQNWYQFSSGELNRAYNENEPDYTMNLLKESNPDYKP